MKKIICTISIILIMVAMAGTVFAITGTTNTNDLNLRDGASLTSNVLTKLNKNETLNIIEEDGDWYKVTYKNYTGYVSKQYLNKNENTNQPANQTDNQSSEENNVIAGSKEAKIVSASTVYVLPLLNSTKIGTLEKGKTVTIISEVGNWKYVQTDKLIGWILNNTIEQSSSTDNNDTNNENENQISNENSNEENNNEENNVVNQVNNNNSSSNNETSSNTTSNNANNNNSGNNSYPTTLYVNVDAVNIREKATTSSDVIASVGRNNPVKVTGESGDWYKVEVSDGKGYIMKQYLSKSQN